MIIGFGNKNVPLRKACYEPPGGVLMFMGIHFSVNFLSRSAGFLSRRGLSPTS